MLADSLARALNHRDLFQRNDLTPDFWQSELLQMRERRYVCNVHRQGGKSVTAAAVAVQTALSLSNHTIVIASPSERQSREMIRRCYDLLCGASYKDELTSRNVLHLEFLNSSRIIGLPGNRPENIRGYSVDGILLEEVSFIPDETIHALLPMIAARPDAWIIGIGTPNGQRGFFYETWATDNDWRKIKVRADQCSRISAETLAEQRRIHGPVKFSQEFECEFLSEGGWLICPSLIAECSQPGKYENVFGKL